MYRSWRDYFHLKHATMSFKKLYIVKHYYALPITSLIINGKLSSRYISSKDRDS